jgi:hypothetical protein
VLRVDDSIARGLKAEVDHDLNGLPEMQNDGIRLIRRRSACLHFNLGTPESYGDAFRRLADTDLVDRGLAQRLTQAAGFRNLVAPAL